MALRCGPGCSELMVRSVAIVSMVSVSAILGYQSAEIDVVATTERVT
jgi:hypothetical protein